MIIEDNKLYLQSFGFIDLVLNLLILIRSVNYLICVKLKLIFLEYLNVNRIT